MSEALYTASVTSTGGGRDGRVTGDFESDIRPPKELGGSGEGANPETLFAAAWAACFNGALQKTMKEAGVSVSDHEPSVTADVTLNKVSDGFRLSGEILVEFAGEPLENASELVAKAHEFCPYSRAVRGDFDAKAGLK
ncbi:Organic hydroperoxide resistance protein OhrB [Corynebacterium kalinowskii]|uniref:Organic hydroperoxide resistance protein OhrB n=1 Tax=Corynebacterium kalinowskii TaxID=2675216 RepID=A0A6B8W0B3_9CORY|nr:Ohr family peroxiredoxin [Corynebacterium kalinowskii]QGU03040.1 Organic hydroperoxide resistance protein OhrB [Corynebacterium kalinowskii]